MSLIIKMEYAPTGQYCKFAIIEPEEDIFLVWHDTACGGEYYRLGRVQFLPYSNLIQTNN